MRYRVLSQPNNDYTFGLGPQNFLVNSPSTVAQAVLTSLKLFQGEWFLNLNAGVPWNTQVLGYGTQAIYDSAIRAAILGVQGVLSIASYASSLNTKTRLLTVAATINTAFGKTSVNTTLSLSGRGYGFSSYGAGAPFGDG
jgi:hypothetical protein